jgi:hypothetical protein
MPASTAVALSSATKTNADVATLTAAEPKVVELLHSYQPTAARASSAANRVQKAYGLVTAAGETVQVRYLANPAKRWVNGHVVDFRSGVDLYGVPIATGQKSGGSQICSILT